MTMEMLKEPSGKRDPKEEREQREKERLDAYIASEEAREVKFRLQAVRNVWLPGALGWIVGHLPKELQSEAAKWRDPSRVSGQFVWWTGVDTGQTHKELSWLHLQIGGRQDGLVVHEGSVWQVPTMELLHQRGWGRNYDVDVVSVPEFVDGKLVGFSGDYQMASDMASPLLPRRILHPNTNHQHPNGFSEGRIMEMFQFCPPAVTSAKGYFYSLGGVDYIRRGGDELWLADTFMQPLDAMNAMLRRVDGVMRRESELDWGRDALEETIQYADRLNAIGQK